MMHIPLPLDFTERAKLAIAAYYGTDSTKQDDRDRAYEVLRMVSAKLNFFRSKCDKCGEMVEIQDGLIFEKRNPPGLLYHIDCVKEHCGIKRVESGRLF